MGLAKGIDYKMDRMKVYAFLHNCCTCESAAETISLHKTLKGAYQAMRKHRLKLCVEHRETRLKFGKKYYNWKYDNFRWWGIEKVDVIE